jgi:hypothetical protein
MNKIKYDEELNRRLNGLNQTLELEGQDGKTIGRFVPEDEYQQWRAERKAFYDWVMSQCPTPEAELERIAREEKDSDGVPLSEIWKQLGVQT